MSKLTRTEKILLTVFLGLFPLIPLVSQAQIVPDCPNGECGYNELLMLVNNVIKYLILIAAPVATIVFSYAGYLYLTTAVADKKNKAKEMLQKVFVGLVIMLSAWLIVSTILNALLNDKYREAVPIERV